MKHFSNEKQNFQSWNYYPQVLDYQDFWITGCQIKAILLYLRSEKQFRKYSKLSKKEIWGFQIHFVVFHVRTPHSDRWLPTLQKNILPRSSRLSTPKNEAVRSYKMLEITCQTTWHHSLRENNEYVSQFFLNLDIKKKRSKFQTYIPKVCVNNGLQWKW